MNDLNPILVSYKYIINYSTMSLKEQLSLLQKDKVKRIGPGAIVPSLLLDKDTSRNTSIDVLYTMAILGFNKLKNTLVQSGRMLGQQLLSDAMKDINRNKLTKTQNKQLSLKIVKFLVMICPFFQNQCCLIVIEYMLRNFSVHIFQGEQIGVIYMQYWQDPHYIKLIKNIDIKSERMNWLKELQTGKNINFSYIIKTIGFNRNIFELLVVYTKSYIREELTEPEGIDMIMSRPTTDRLIVESTSVIENSMKQFLLRIMLELLQKQMNLFFKDILEFCHFASKCDLRQVNDMCIMISLLALSNGHARPQYGYKILRNIIGMTIHNNVFDFVMVMWQRYPKIFDSALISQILKLQDFIVYIRKFKHSKSMLLYSMLQAYMNAKFEQKSLCMQVMQVIVESVKEQAFIKANESTYYKAMFAIINKELNHIQSKLKKAIVRFLKNNLLYELSVYGNQKEMKSIFSELFPKQNNIAHKLQEIVKEHKEYVRIKSKKEQDRMEQQQHNEEQQQLQSEYKQQVVERVSLLSIVNSKLNQQFRKIDYKNEQVKNILTELVNDYYKSKGKEKGDMGIDKQHKNNILQHTQLFNIYTQEYFITDLLNNDYNTAIKYLVREKSVEMAKRVLQANEYDKLNDILYKELMRVSINIIVEWGTNNQNKVIQYVGKLYNNYLRTQGLQVCKLMNHIMNKISNLLISQCGIRPIKLFKLLSAHTKMFVKLFSNAVDQNMLEYYQHIIAIFSTQYIYAILIGVSQMLTHESSNNISIGKFIKQIYIPSLQEHTSQISVNIEKMLVFGCHMLVDGDDVSDELLIRNVSVSKKMMIKFFGLRNKQTKRLLVRKLIIFLLQLIKESRFVAIFKNNLKEIGEKEENELVKKYCSIYSMLFKMSQNVNGPLRPAIRQLKQCNLGMFPLQLKINVFCSLLPQEQAYQLLGQQLKEHPQKQFDNIQELVSIQPQTLSDGWCQFIQQCMRRKSYPSYKITQSILNKPINHNLIQFICSYTKYGPQQSLNHIDKIMQIVFEVCSQEQNQKYSMAVFYRIISNMGQFMHPYLQQIFTICIQYKKSQYVERIMEIIVQLFMPPTLIQLLKNNYKTVQNIHNFTLFISKVVDKVSYETILKDIKSFFSRSLNQFVVQEQDYSKMHEMEAQIIQKIVLKMNEDDLRKTIREYHGWSSQKTKYDQDFIFNTRRSLLLHIFYTLQKKLGKLFNNFYGFIFQSLTQDLDIFYESLRERKQKNSSKRQRQMSEYSMKCAYKYICICLNALTQLFKNDPHSEFMDAQKFDEIAPKLASLFNITQLNQLYPKMVENALEPCLLSFYKNTKDDYRLKSLNNKILQQLRAKDMRIQVGIFKLLEKVSNELEHRILIFTDDLVPILLQSSNSRNSDIKSSVKNIIYQIQQISGERIENYMS